MADNNEQSNTVHFQGHEENRQHQQLINNNQAEPIIIDDDDDNQDNQNQPEQQQQQQQRQQQIDMLLFDQDTDEDYRRYLIHLILSRTQGIIEPDDDEDEDYVADEMDDDDDDDEEDNDDANTDEDEVEDMDVMVTSPRVSVNPVEAVGEPKFGEEGAKATAAGEGGEIEGLNCPICLGPWTSGGDHQLCSLSCGHLYGLSCISKWIEHRKSSAKCPQCNRKCKRKDVRVLYASRVVVADEESKEKIQFLEAKCALLEKKNETLIKKSNGMMELIGEQSKLLSQQTERVNHLMTTQQSEMKALQAAQAESAKSMKRLREEHTESERRFQLFEAQQSESLQRIRQWIAVAAIDVSRPLPPLWLEIPGL